MDDEYGIEKLEEAARLLYSSITSEASEYPNSKDKLFISQKDSWRLNACISSYKDLLGVADAVAMRPCSGHKKARLEGRARNGAALSIREMLGKVKKIEPNTL